MALRPDLVRDDQLTVASKLVPGVAYIATVIDTTPLRVTVPTIDSGARALRAFGTWPDAAAGDEMRVTVDERGGLVAVQWEPAP